MTEKRIPIIEAVAFGLRAVLEHSRLFFFVLFETIGILVLVVFLLGIFNRDLAYSLFITMKESAYYQGTITALNISTASPLIVLCSILLISVVFFGFDLGFKRIAFEIHDFGDSNAGKILSCFYLVPQALVAWILYGITPIWASYLWTCGIYIPSFLGFLYGIPLFIGLLVLLIIGVFFMFRCMFFTYCIVDKQVGAFAALQMSWNMTRDYQWDLLAFVLVMKMIAYIGYMTIFGWMLVWPLTTLSHVFVYRRLQEA